MSDDPVLSREWRCNILTTCRRPKLFKIHIKQWKNQVNMKFWTCAADIMDRKWTITIFVTHGTTRLLGYGVSISDKWSNWRSNTLASEQVIQHEVQIANSRHTMESVKCKSTLKHWKFLKFNSATSLVCKNEPGWFVNAHMLKFIAFMCVVKFDQAQISYYNLNFSLIFPLFMDTPMCSTRNPI